MQFIKVNFDLAYHRQGISTAHGHGFVVRHELQVPIISETYHIMDYKLLEKVREEAL